MISLHYTLQPTCCSLSEVGARQNNRLRLFPDLVPQHSRRISSHFRFHRVIQFCPNQSVCAIKVSSGCPHDSHRKQKHSRMDVAPPDIWNSSAQYLSPISRSAASASFGFNLAEEREQRMPNYGQRSFGTTHGQI
jgi:hypothetical protein